MLVHTGLAGAMESELMTSHRQVVFCLDALIDRLVQIDLRQINNCSTAVADEMTVGCSVAVEPLLTVDYTHTLDGAVLLKEHQVPVNRSQTQIRMLRLQLLIHPLS